MPGDLRPPSPVPLPDFLAQQITTPPYLVDPYVPAGGIVFLYGKPSLGKSPLTWKMAQCVALGVPFLGCPTAQATVLYIDVDGTPAAELQKRLKLLPQPYPADFQLVLMAPFNIVGRGAESDLARTRLAQMSQSVKPGLVIVNTLRKVHWADDKESDVPSRVYTAFHGLFPGASILFVHHDKKTVLGPSGASTEADEAFSGSQAWLNDATVGLHLVRHGAEGLLRLDHTKTQVSERKPPLMLVLAPDGTTLTTQEEHHFKRLEAAWADLDPAWTKQAKVTAVRGQLGVSESTVWRWLRKWDTVKSPKPHDSTTST